MIETVQQAIDALSKQDPNAKFGVSNTDLTGWTQKVRGLAIAEGGIVCFDTDDETHYEEEVDIDRV